MIRHYRSTILQIALEISRLCIVHILSTHKLHLFVKTPTYIPIHPNVNESVKVRKFLGGSLWWSKICIDYQTFCYKISWNYLKFWGRESEQSLILNLNPSPSEKNCVKSCIFCAKTNQFYSKFSWGGPQTPPLIHIFHSFLTLCWKKRRNKEVQTNSRIKNDLLNPITYPPPFFFFFASWI